MTPFPPLEPLQQFKHRPASCLSGTSKEIHIIPDNFSAHKTKKIGEFLEQNPRARFHFTPTHSSLLNQAEIWFAKIQRDVIDRGIFTSVADLSRKLKATNGTATRTVPSTQDW